MELQQFFMVPMDLELALKLREYLELNPLVELYLIKKDMEDRLMAELNRNVLLREQFVRQQLTKVEKKCDPPKEESEFEEFSEEESVSEQERKRKSKKIKRNQKNDTKNIPKNFGKAIITFIQEKRDLVKRALAVTGAQYEPFVEVLKSKKKNLHSISEIRSLWLESSFQFAKEMRMLSLYFMRRGCLEYVFGSRVANYAGHIKYRKRFIEVLKSPQHFTCIKN